MQFSQPCQKFFALIPKEIRIFQEKIRSLVLIWTRRKQFFAQTSKKNYKIFYFFPQNVPLDT